MCPSRTICAIALCQMLGLTSSTSTKAYDKFRHTYRNDNAEDSQSYAERYALFQANIAEIEAHNAKKAFMENGHQ
jgi:hypothetical protein